MARPGILRADTLDLQDQDSPTASEHHKHPHPNSNAPHVAAQVHQVLEERHSEEQALADAWNITGSLADSTGAIDQAQANNNATEHVTNGASHASEEGGEGAESDAETDDDMMDRISSSPSIDDGAFSLHYSHPVSLQRYGPARVSDVSPAPSLSTPTRESFNQTANTTPESSPFLQTPQHLPLRARQAGLEDYTLAQQVASSSPYDQVPQDFPSRTLSLPVSKYHQMGRYEEDRAGHEDGPDLASEDEDGYEADRDYDTRRPIESPFRNHSFFTSMTSLGPPSLDPSPSLTSINSLDLDALLLPVDDPLLDTPPSPNGSAGSWESMSNSDRDSLEVHEDCQNFDDAEDTFLNLDDRFIDSGWGGECLRETEDIDFEFVYALHTFVATVEGQANATKGDTMVLLDDSNSYWWLVRVVKDSSIGYLPAEHIETPTERLARLNKHRNIDLSATMLSDNSEKSRNPMKKAMRRRKAKTVQFAAPTYVEASDYDYSTEDEEHMIDPYGSSLQSEGRDSTDETEIEVEEPKAEPADSQLERRSSTSSQRASFDREQAATAAQALAAAGINNDENAPKLVDKTGEFERFGIDDSFPTVSTEAAPLKSKKTRNTDSFLKDDSLETRKITLTPGILREENGAAKSPTEPTRNNSLESLTKTSSPTEQPPAGKETKTKEKKKEPKKGGMLSGLFKSKKKDKKVKEEESEAEKLSADMQRESARSSPLPSGKSSPVEKPVNGYQSPARTNVQHQAPAEEVRETSNDSNNGFVAELEGSAVAYEMAASHDEPEGQDDPQHRINVEAAQQEKSRGIGNPLSPITSTVTNTVSNILKTSDGHDKPKKAKRSKQRVELDDFDSPQDEQGKNPFADQTDDSEESGDRLSESPVEIHNPAFMHGTDSIHIPMMGPEDHTEDDEPGSLTSSPSIIEHPAEPLEDDAGEDNDPTPTARSPQPVVQPQKLTKTPTRGLSTDSNTSSRLSPRPSPTVSSQAWSDDSLRAWLEDGSEVRDMLVMIHDKSGVTPARPDHPLMEGLFVEQKKGVTQMMGELDGLLGSYLQRKGMKF